MRVLIDTCVIVDALQDRQPFAGDARSVFLAVANRAFIGCITAKAVTDIHYLTRRLLHSEERTRDILRKLFSLFDVVDTLGLDCIQAAQSRIADYEDAVMAETALRISADYIVTRNLRDYSRSTIPVLSPAELLAML